MTDPWRTVVAELMEAGPVGVLAIDGDMRIVHANAVACEILRRDLVGVPILDLIHPDDVERVAAAAMVRTWGEPRERGRGSLWRMVLPDGGNVEILTYTSLVTVGETTYAQLGFLPAPRRLAVLKSLEDVAAARPLPETLAALIDGIVSDESGLSINWVDLDGRVHLFGNLDPVLAGVGGDGRRDPDPTTPWAEAAASGSVARRLDLDGLRPEVADAARAAGYAACCVTPITDPGTGLALLYVNWVWHPSHVPYVQQTFADVLHDVVQVALDRAEDARQLHHAAHHDQLTDLANRRAFFDALTSALEGGPVGVLYLDLDDFKPVNDRFGHHAGDQVLVTVADRLRQHAPADAIVGRLGGDEFAIVVPDGDGDAIEELAARLVAEVSQPIALESRGDVTVGVSVGFSVSDGSVPRDPTALVSAADDALRAAKGAGKGNWVRSSS